MRTAQRHRYLGSFVSYNLSDDYDISQRITKAYQMMGMLNNLWRNDHVDLYSKYLFFLAMPISQLLWGCEGWALKESNFDDLDVFLHRSIRKISAIFRRTFCIFCKHFHGHSQTFAFSYTIFIAIGQIFMFQIFTDFLEILNCIAIPRNVADFLEKTDFVSFFQKN